MRPVTSREGHKLAREDKMYDLKIFLDILPVLYIYKKLHLQYSYNDKENIFSMVTFI